MIGIGSIFVLFFVAFAFSNEALRIALHPYNVMVEKLERYYTEQAEEELKEDPAQKREKYFVFDGERERLRNFQDTRMQSVAPGETFFFELKICVYVSLFVGSPILLWQLWMFVGAGLYKREKRVILQYFPTAAFLFVAGILFGYFVLVPYAMYFLNRTTPLDIVRPDFRIQEYFDFMSSLCFGLGVAFQLPIAMLVLARLDIVSPDVFAKYRGHTWVIVMIVAGFLTPPDPYTQSMMALPMLLLYEVGIVWGRMSAKGRT
jgi:Tat protein translocase TatC